MAPAATGEPNRPSKAATAAHAMLAKPSAQQVPKHPNQHGAAAAAAAAAGAAKRPPGAAAAPAAGASRPPKYSAPGVVARMPPGALLGNAGLAGGGLSGPTSVAGLGHGPRPIGGKPGVAPQSTGLQVGLQNAVGVREGCFWGDGRARIEVGVCPKAAVHSQHGICAPVPTTAHVAPL